MINEGIVGSDSRIALRSEMLRQIHRLESATPEVWERAVFESLTGARREDVDWEVEDNQAGYYTWVKSFDALIEELVSDGFVRQDTAEDGSLLVAETTDPSLDWSSVADPLKV